MLNTEKGRRWKKGVSDGEPLSSMVDQGNAAMSALELDEAPDIHSSSDEYANRFRGPLGAWILETQFRAVSTFLASTSAKTVLDVGGGHAQIAPGLGDLGYSVTVLGSTPECSHRLQKALADGKCDFTVGSMLELPFEDKSFDAVVCLRQVNHLENWPRLLEELCRVSRKAVIIDYPSRRSFNIVSALLFPLKRLVEGNTRRFSVFPDRVVVQTFAQNGFPSVLREPLFFLPLALYRIFGSRRLAEKCEGFFHRTGLTSAFGSPVIAVAVQDLINFLSV